MTPIAPKIARNVAVIGQERTVLDAAQLMVERYIGSVVVDGGGHVNGIFTERDLMRAVAQGRDPARTLLKEVMRTQLVRVAPSDSIEHCLELMRKHRCRHLLVYEGDEFVGIVSLRDLAALMLEEKEALVEQLTRYITS